MTATLEEGYEFGTLGDSWEINEDGTATWTYQLQAIYCDIDEEPTPTLVERPTPEKSPTPKEPTKPSVKPEAPGDKPESTKVSETQADKAVIDEPALATTGINGVGIALATSGLLLLIGAILLITRRMKGLGRNS